MDGKEKCRVLREIREKIARANELEFECVECTHEGPCRGTCPRCEQEAAQLEKAMQRRAAMGKRVALVGLCAGIALTGAGCSVVDDFLNGDVMGIVPYSETEVLEGDVVCTDDLVGIAPEIDPLAGEAVCLDDLYGLDGL